MDRIGFIVNLIPKDAVVVDIGTDHCKVPNALIQKGYKKVYATEASSGPLEQAKRNALPGVIISLHDGLKGFTEAVDTAVIAGMGGELIKKILKESLPAFRGMTSIILQPMQQIESLRNFLLEENFLIDKEEICREGDKYYQIFRVRAGKDEPYDTRYFKGQPSEPELLREYYLKEEKRVAHLLTIRENEEDSDYLQGLRNRI